MEEENRERVADPPSEVPDHMESVAGSVPYAWHTPADCGCGCDRGEVLAAETDSVHEDGGCGPTIPSYVYVLGKIDYVPPSRSIEKELAQIVGRADASQLTDRQAVHQVISQPENRYLARQLCYVLSVHGIETYILRPRDCYGLDLLIDAIRPEPRPSDLDVVIGVRGPLASPALCNGLTVPVVTFDQIYSFDTEELVRAIERPEGMTAEQFEPACYDLLRQVMQLGDNAGDTDEARVLNYIAVRYPRFYEKTVEAYADNFALSAVQFRASRLSGTSRIIDVVVSYTHRRTDVTEKHFVRVACDGEFPYLVTKLSPYYDR
ncbi:hypothetical protein [Streptomyces sp. NPDC051452]|uniref:cyanobactin maturation protease PatG family protein n=1 Tax=Streptomyces sp. NPDC051452 TaxID=3365654 RepID=UPI0037BD3F49